MFSGFRSLYNILCLCKCSIARIIYPINNLLTISSNITPLVMYIAKSPYYKNSNTKYKFFVV